MPSSEPPPSRSPPAGSSQPAPSRAPLSAVTRLGLLVLAWLSLASAALGVVLPVLPTVPFVLVAARAAARSSPRLSTWLLQHPRFGHLIRDWHAGGVVQRRSKWIASATMAASALLMLWWVGPRWPAWLAMACMGSVLLWLWRRPEALPPALTDAH